MRSCTFEMGWGGELPVFLPFPSLLDPQCCARASGTSPNPSPAWVRVETEPLHLSENLVLTQTCRGGYGDFDTLFSFKANCAMHIYTTYRPQNSLRSLSESILSRSYARANVSKNGQSATIRWDCNRDPLATPYDHSARKIAQHHAQLGNKVSLAASILVRG